MPKMCKIHVCKLMGPDTIMMVEGNPCDQFGCDVDRRRACYLENRIRSWIDGGKQGAPLRIIIEDMEKTLKGG